MRNKVVLGNTPVKLLQTMQQTGDYLDWYGTEQGYEGIVDDEIKEDFLKLGWAIRN